MKHFCFIIYAAIICVSASAQDFKAVLSEVERNNATLQALRDEALAARQSARTELAPDDPEVGVNYLWETEAESGNRLDLSLTQSFDFPTVYYWKKKVADGECSAADLNYAVERKNLLQEAEEICINLVYRNALQKQLQRCAENAKAVAEACQKSFDSGDAGIIDLNKAKLASLSAQKELKANEVELTALNASLVSMNGGQPVAVTADTFETELLPADFETWYQDALQTSSELRAVDNSLAVAESSVRLASSEWLPKFSLGYVSERIDGSTLQGIGGGISIPLWANAGKVRAAKARQAAAQSKAQSSKLNFYNTLKAKYSQALSLQQLSAEYLKTLEGIDSSDLMLQALEGGQIGIADYIYGTELWYDAYSEALATQRDCHVLMAELRRFEE